MKERRPRAGSRRFGRLLLRGSLVLLCALLMGMGWSLYRQERWLPSLEGNLYSILATEGSIFMVLSQGDNNSLVRTDHRGELLNYAGAPIGQAYQDLEVAGNTVYAILAASQEGEQRQTLVALSLEDTFMKPKQLAELTVLENAPADDILWREIYLPPEGEAAPALRLVGIDGAGRGWLLRWSLETGRAELEPIMEGEKLFMVKYVSDDRYVWIDQDGRAGQSIGGVPQEDILDGLSKTPYHISTCENRCFLSDSVTGDIFEILPDGTAKLWRLGADPIGDTDRLYRQLERFTVYVDSGGDLRVTGMCAEGDGGAITGETHAFSDLRAGVKRVYLAWRYSWKLTALLYGLLTILVEIVCGIFRSHRLAVRLSLCELVIAAILLGSVTAIQYGSFRETMLRGAWQKLHLIGGNLAVALTGDDDLDRAEIALRVARLREEVDTAMSDTERAYSVSVLWSTENGPAIGCDSTLPEGYLVEDLRSRAYLTAISEILQGGGDDLRIIQNDMGRDYVYLQRFSQGGRTGCVVVAQSERTLRTGQAKFFQRMLPILAACPLLFLALVWITRRILRPLDEIKRALEEFYADGGGNQMVLDGMPRTELYEVGRVFNQLSVQTRTQFNTLNAINDSYARLAPECILKFLRRRDVTELSPGEHTAVSGGLLMLLPERAAESAGELQGLARIAADQTAAHGGMLVDYDNGLGALAALFPDPGRALGCAQGALDDFEKAGRPVMAAVLDDEVEFGVFGGQELLLPLAVSERLERRQAALKRLSSFGAVLVESGAGRPGLRSLGWDRDVAYFEDPAYRPVGWQTGWRDAGAFWERALAQFRSGAFAPAMRGFAQVLRLMPDDGAARWYLFRCAALRDGGQSSDTGLLFDWEGRGHG